MSINLSKKQEFQSEANLCAQFIEAVGDNRHEKWIAYPETHGWDILLVRATDGLQIGIQAKLSLNAKVLEQASEYGHYPEAKGPDLRAVLVPYNKTDLASLAAYCGLTVIRVWPKRETASHFKSFASFSPSLPMAERRYVYADEWFNSFPCERHVLPDYVPDVVAGSGAPVQLTEWKIKAIKLLVLLKKRGYIVRADFKHLKMDHRRWIAPGAGWLKAGEKGWIAGARLPDFKGQHPRNFKEIEKDWNKWKPSEDAASD